MTDMRTLTTLFFLLFSWCLSAQLILKVVTIPAGTPSGVELYVAGSFNDSNPADPGYRLERDAAGNYHTQLFVAAGPVAFKIRRSLIPVYRQVDVRRFICPGEGFALPGS